MSRERDDNSGWSPGCGCASPLAVLTIGLALSIFGASVGGGCSVRIPFTEASISSAGSIGSKESTRRALPPYLEHRIGSNKDFVNSSADLTIWLAEGTGVFVIGEQPGAPGLDLHLNLTTRNQKYYPSLRSQPEGS